jgi:hypothetical protein
MQLLDPPYTQDELNDLRIRVEKGWVIRKDQTLRLISSIETFLAIERMREALEDVPQPSLHG